MPAQITVEVAYAKPDKQRLIVLNVPCGTTVKQAIELSNILSEFPEIVLAKTSVGIFGQLCPLETVLKSHDRVEIYRPLLCNPMQARRNRAQKIVKS